MSIQAQLEARRKALGLARIKVAHLADIPVGVVNQAARGIHKASTIVTITKWVEALGGKLKIEWTE